MSKTDAITRLAVAKHHAARQRVVTALDDWPTSRSMTFAAVCQAAKVSKTFLYDPRQADLAECIRHRRAQPLERNEVMTTAVLRGKSDMAKDAQIARLQERVRLQEQELQRLRTENATLYGRLAERS